MVFIVTPAWAAQLVYPGPAPCDTTLQACINAAAAGDTIDIATDEAIDEQLSISHSLTLRPAPGFSPLIGDSETVRGINIGGLGSGGSTDKQSVFIEGLSLINARITGVLSTGAGGHHIELRNNQIAFEFGNNNTAGIDLDFRLPGTVLIEGNKVTSTGQGIRVRASGGSGQFEINRNIVTTSLPAESNSGLDMRVTANGNYAFNAISNIIYSVAGCRCGRASGILLELSSSAQITANISHNTLYDVQEVGNGIWANVTDPGAELNLTLFNNTVSSAGQAGYRVIFGASSSTLSAGGNNSFGNAQPDQITDQTTLATNTAFNPQFVQPGAGNFQLKEGSALIDAGVMGPAIASLSSDAAGFARPAGPAVDVGALEFGAEPVFLINRREAFLELPGVQLASAPYPNNSSPGSPFVSGDIALETFAPSSLNFGSWPADFPGDNNIELALNDAENLIIRSSTGPVRGMGIDFSDATGGSNPSTFDVELYASGTQVGRLTFRAPGLPQQDFVGVWSPVPFDELRILEKPNANENEFFGSVYTTQAPATRVIFADGLEAF